MHQTQELRAHIPIPIVGASSAEGASSRALDATGDSDSFLLHAAS